MKKYKSLLWFVIPMFAALIFILNFSFSPRSLFPPAFLGIGDLNYFQLFVRDPLFKQALLYTAVIYILLLSVLFVIMFLVLRVIRKKKVSSHRSILFYVISLLIIFIICLCFYFGIGVLGGGLSASAYTVHTMISGVTVLLYLSDFFNPISVVQSLFIAFLIGSIVRFIDIKISAKNNPK